LGRIAPVVESQEASRMSADATEVSWSPVERQPQGSTHKNFDRELRLSPP
jgi:hypothetical protein